MMAALLVLVLVNVVGAWVQHRRIARVRALCAEWDRYSKGESPTTARIRAAINGRHT